MGKFDGMLICTDLDGTLLKNGDEIYTSLPAKSNQQMKLFES